MLASIYLLNVPVGFLDELCLEFEKQAPGECAVELLPSSAALLKRLAESRQDVLVVVPLKAKPNSKTYQALKSIREKHADIPILAVAEAGNAEAAAQAVEAGANDLLVLGSALSKRVATVIGKMRSLLGLLQRTRALVAENAQLQQSVSSQFRIEGNSPQVRKLLKQIATVANIPRPLLITGERGTGKELVARAVHVAANESSAASSDISRPMITVNCAAFSDTLLESELFGHERGSFTGANEAREGKFAQADGGTLFLDEIGNMTLPFQQKILRVVEYGTYTRIGGSQELKTTARVIAATNINLKDLINEGKFLSDLYDRLAFEVVNVPPLRERGADIEMLARFFLDRFSLEIPTLGGKSLAQSAIDVLNAYHFPGNIRELKNIIERAACRDTTNEITPEDLGMINNEPGVAPSGSFREQVDQFQRNLINDAMGQVAGNQAAAARKLGLTYDQFRYYARKLLS